MGSVYRRKSDGRWTAAISIGPRAHRTLLIRYAPKDDNTKRAAQALLDDLRSLARPAIGSRRTTVGAYLRSWLETGGRRSLKASTWRTYDVALRLHIEPTIGHIPLARLGPDDVDDMLARLDLAPKGQINVLGFLGRVLDVAQRRRLVTWNAARLVELPRYVRDDQEGITLEQARRILELVRGDRLEAMWVIILATGVRLAEALGLRWDDVAPDYTSITVRYALARVDGRYVLEETKGRNVQALALPGFAATALRDHRARQLEERLAAGTPTMEGLVFVAPTGRPLNEGWVSHRWPKIVRPHGLTVTIHGLRHGQSSMLVELGVHPRVIQHRMRHKTITQSMDRYAHVAEASDREVASALQEALG